MGQIQEKTQTKLKNTFAKDKKAQKRLVRYGIFTANFVMLLAVTLFVLRSPKTTPSIVNNSINSTDSTVASSALDQLSSADIAVNAAKMANLPEALSVANKADTVNAQLAVGASDDSVVAKPQVVSTSLKSYRDIFSYRTVKGDTIDKLAKKFGITSDSIRWSNGLEGNNVKKGTKLYIPPVDGIAYLVKRKDTLDGLATKYSINKQQLIADNDLETSGLRVGTRILIRGGKVASPRIASVANSRTASWSGAVYGYNGYDYGYCTWYVANRRAQAGNPVPSNLGNASTWKALAQLAGFSVGTRPKAGAVIWTPPRDYYGHVGYVEKVYGDGSVLVSEMNTKGWAVRSTKTLTASEASRYYYIY